MTISKILYVIGVIFIMIGGGLLISMLPIPLVALTMLGTVWGYGVVTFGIILYDEV